MNKQFLINILRSNSFIIKSSNIIKTLLLTLILTNPAFGIPQRASILIKDSPKEVLDQVWQIVYRDFLDTTGNFDNKKWMSTRKKILSNKYKDSSEGYEAIRGMLITLKDPYTRFLDPKEFDEMRIDTTGQLMGVGIQISYDEEKAELIVVSPIEDSPAYRAGIQPNDIIISIDEEYTDGMGIEDAVKLIRGKKGTKVILGIIREEKFFKITLVREKIEIKSVISRVNEADFGIKIGYIRLKQFNSNAANEMKSAINKLESQNSTAYVLDLRGNPGGLLESSIEIARQWLNQGIIVSTKTKNGITDIRRANGNAITSRPLAILVNQSSASASEILSGAIQDNNRGFLVGKKTFGKGLVQSVRPLVDGSGLTVTVAKYLTPKGKDIDKYGIAPDIEADLKLKGMKNFTSFDLGTKKDSQYVAAEIALIKRLSNRSSVKYNQNTKNLTYALK